MEYELLMLLNWLGLIVVTMIIGYHFLGIKDRKSKDN